MTCDPTTYKSYEEDETLLLTEMLYQGRVGGIPIQSHPVSDLQHDSVHIV